MSRDTEINALRQSLLAMRKISSRGTSALKKPKSPRSPQRLKGGVNFSSNKDIKLNGNINKNKSQGDDNSSVRGKSSSSPSTTKSIEVRMPYAKINRNKNQIVEESGKDDEESDSDLSSDIDDDVEDGLEEQSNSSDGDSVDSINTVNKKNKLNHRPESNTTSRGISVVSKKKNIQAKSSDPLARIMSELNLDELPPSWYTEVVPASDVHVSRRTFIGSKDANDYNNRNSPHKRPIYKNRRKMASYLRPATTGGDIFSQKSNLPMNRRESQSHPQQQARPFTSAGVRSWTDDSQEKRPKSRLGIITKLKNDDESQRPQSVLFCEQSLHSSKTLWQLKEEEMQSSILDIQSPLDILLKEAKEEQRVIDKKVRLFVKSLEEKKRSERLKRLMSESNLLKSSPSW